MFLSFTYLFVVILLAILRPKIFIYYYLIITYLIPVVTTYYIRLDEPQYYIAKIGFIPIGYLNELILILMSVIFSFEILLKIKKFSGFFRKFIYFLAIYIVSMLSLKLLKVLLFMDLESQTTAIASVFVLPALCVNILCFFSGKQIKKLFNNFFLLFHNHFYFVHF